LGCFSDFSVEITKISQMSDVYIELFIEKSGNCMTSGASALRLSAL